MVWQKTHVKRRGRNTREGWIFASPNSAAGGPGEVEIFHFLATHRSPSDGRTDVLSVSAGNGRSSSWPRSSRRQQRIKGGPTGASKTVPLIDVARKARNRGEGDAVSKKFDFCGYHSRISLRCAYDSTLTIYNCNF